MDFHRRVEMERDIDLLHIMAASHGSWKSIMKQVKEMQKHI